jgi:ABC-type sulfate transport system permease component
MVMAWARATGTGGAAVKLAPITPLGFEVLDMLIFEGLLRIAQERG